MNALTPTTVGHAITPYVLTYETLIRRIAGQNPPIVSIVRLAEEIGMDKANLRRSLVKLEEEEGVIVRNEDGAPTGVTDRGRQILAALDRAAGMGLAVPLSRTVDQLAVHPDNPRTLNLDDPQEREDIEELLGLIVGAGMLWQPLEVQQTPDGEPDLVRRGQRRLAAIRLGIERGLLAADWPIEIKPLVSRGRFQDILDDLAHNTSSRPPHALDLAHTYTICVDGFLAENPGMLRGEAAAIVAKSSGKSDKHVESYILMLARASDDEKRRMRLPRAHPEHLGVKAAIEGLRPHKDKPALPDMTPELILLLGEVWHASTYRRAAEPRMAAQGWTDTAAFQGDGLIRSLSSRGYVEQWANPQTDDGPAWARVAPKFERSEDFKKWLHETGLDRDAPHALRALQAAGIGDLQAAALTPGEYATPFLNLPEAVEEPEPAPQTPPAEPKAIDTLPGYLRLPSGAITLEADPSAVLLDIYARPYTGPDPDTAAIYDGTVYPNADMAAEAQARAMGETFAGAPQRDQLSQDIARLAKEEQDGLDLKAPPGALATLVIRERMNLIELAHLIGAKGMMLEGRGEEPFAAVGDYFKDETANTLQRTHGLTAYMNVAEYGRLARLTPKGRAWLEGNGFPAGHITDQALAEARKAAGWTAPEGKYVCQWLNRSEPKGGPSEEDAAEDAAVVAGADFEDVLEGLNGLLRDRYEQLTPEDHSLLAVADGETLAHHARLSLEREAPIDAVHFIAQLIQRNGADQAGPLIALALKQGAA